MEDIMNVIFNYGVGVACLGYLMYFQLTTMKDNNQVLDEIQKTLVAIQTTLQSLSGRVDNIEHEVNKKKKDEEKEI